MEWYGLSDVVGRGWLVLADYFCFRDVSPAHIVSTFLTSVTWTSQDQGLGQKVGEGAMEYKELGFPTQGSFSLITISWNIL